MEAAAEDDDELRAADGRVPGRRGRATRQKLLEQTAEMMQTTSFRELKVVDIARGAGTSPATFYQYFPDVEAAILAWPWNPLLGDAVYGGTRLRLPKQAQEATRRLLQQFPRQALHAAQLGLVHPETEEDMQWQAPLPSDMQQLLQVLQQEAVE